MKKIVVQNSGDHKDAALFWPLFFAFIRLPLVIIGSAIVILAYRLSGNPVGLAAGLGWSTLTLTGVNLVCLALLYWRSRIAFPLLNPLVEELQYRGYAQPGLVARMGSPWPGILITALGFGLQHVVFAVTLPAALAYSAGFFLWGIGAGWIAQRQKRLAQVIVAHFISNLSFGIIPLFFVLGAG